VITNKLTFDPPTRLPELTQNLLRSSHGHFTPFLKVSRKSVQPFSRITLLTKKQRNKERNRPKTIPRPGGGVIILIDRTVALLWQWMQQVFFPSSDMQIRHCTDRHMTSLTLHGDSAAAWRLQHTDVTIISSQRYKQTHMVLFFFNARVKSTAF